MKTLTSKTCRRCESPGLSRASVLLVAAALLESCAPSLLGNKSLPSVGDTVLGEAFAIAQVARATTTGRAQSPRRFGT